jgi:hypothetical protein
MADKHTIFDSEHTGTSNRACSSNKELLEDHVLLRLAIERSAEVRNGKSKLYTWEEVKASNGV